MKAKKLISLILAVVLAAIIPVTCLAAEGRRYYGDVDSDGSVTTTDARLCLRIAAQLDAQPTGNDFRACDIDSNGRILTDDARAILRMAAELMGKVFLDGSGKPGDILELMRQINSLRADKSLSQLTPVSAVCGAAATLAKEFAETGNTVCRPGGAYWYTALTSRNITYTHADADYYKGSEEPTFAIGSLSANTQARSNMLNDYFTKIGVGCYIGTDAYYWCIIYIED